MDCRILVVEDEFFVAAEIEHVVEDMGYRPAGIAADKATALALGKNADIALVDLNLRDGPTGVAIGSSLAKDGVTVVFMTANPDQLGTGVPGAIGVISKPVADAELRAAVAYAAARRADLMASPPRRLRLFEALGA